MKNKILIGITLFSMFFGAGNLIFPPFLGAEAGTSGWLAFVGLSFSAVCFPILGVVAVTLSGGADRMADRVHPMFSVVFISALYLAIGPCLAIPRTSGTSFSMAVQPFLPEGMPVGLVQFIYSIIFFTVAARIALHPERLTEYLERNNSLKIQLSFCDEKNSECKTGENIAYAELQKALFYCKRKKYLLLFISVRELIQDIRFYDLLDEYRVDFRCVDFPWFCRENLRLIKAVMLYEKLSS